MSSENRPRAASPTPTKIKVTGNSLAMYKWLLISHPDGVAPPQEMQVVNDQHCFLQAGTQSRRGERSELHCRRRPGVGEERQHGSVELDHAGVAGQSDSAYRPALMSVAGGRSLLLDFALVIFPGEVQNCGGCLPESGKASIATAPWLCRRPGKRCCRRCPRGPRGDSQVAGFDRPRFACHSRRSLLYSSKASSVSASPKLTAGHLFRLQAGGCVNEPLPTFLAGQGEIVHPGFGYRLCGLLFVVITACFECVGVEIIHIRIEVPGVIVVTALRVWFLELLDVAV